MVGGTNGGGGAGEESKGLSSRSWPQLISNSKAASGAATLASPVGDGNGTEEGNKSRRMTSRSVRLTKTKLSMAHEADDFTMNKFFIPINFQMQRITLERHQLSQISGQTFNRRKLRSAQTGLFYTKVVQLQENDRSWTQQ